MRLPQANEDSQRASNHQPPPPERSQATLRLKNRFPKTVRLRTRQEFKRVQREGKRFVAQFLVFQYASENFNYPRLGITVSKQFGSAVSRNLFKRRIREVFRKLKAQFPRGLKVHVSPRHSAGQATLKQVETDFILLLDVLKPIS
jgi:ribonuclease P protein component